jgi:hypothetical protein
VRGVASSASLSIVWRVLFPGGVPPYVAKLEICLFFNGLQVVDVCKIVIIKDLIAKIVFLKELAPEGVWIPHGACLFLIYRFIIAG